MFRSLIFLCLSFFFTLEVLYSQENNEYLMVMIKQKQAVSTAQTEKAFLDLVATFERISSAEPLEWYPLYYTSFCYINLSLANGNSLQKDTYLDNAQSVLNAALEIHPDESELHVLQALLYQGRIQVDPTQRGLSFSIKADQSLDVAKEYNPQNPRIYYLSGLNTLHKPETAGGGTKTACPLFKKAMEKYENYIPPHVLSPTWGADQCQLLLERNCPDLNQKKQ